MFEIKKTTTTTADAHRIPGRMNDAFFWKDTKGGHECFTDQMSGSQLFVSSKWANFGRDSVMVRCVNTEPHRDSVMVRCVNTEPHRTDMTSLCYDLIAVQYNNEALRPHVLLFF